MSVTNKEVRLGATVRDLLTGFTGTAASRVELMGGNVQYAVQPKLNSEAKPGEFPDAMNIDVHTLEVVDDGLADSVTPAPVATIELGDKVEDIVTGVKGIAYSRCTFMNGCIYYNVQPAAEVDSRTGLTVVPERMFLSQVCLKTVKPAVAAPVVPTTSTGRAPGGPSTRAQRAA